jgi:hypothetical protein
LHKKRQPSGSVSFISKKLLPANRARSLVIVGVRVQRFGRFRERN